MLRCMYNVHAMSYVNCTCYYIHTLHMLFSIYIVHVILHVCCLCVHSVVASIEVDSFFGEHKTDKADSLFSNS